MNTKSDIFVSVVAPVSFLQEDTYKSFRALSAKLRNSFIDYEIIIVMNSADARRNDIDPLLQNEANINVFFVNGPFKEDVYWIAGLENSIGDFVIMFDLSTDPIDLIENSVFLAREQDAIIYGAKLTPTPPTRKLFYFLLNYFSGIYVPANISRFRVLNRGVVNFILKAYDRHRIFRIAPALSCSKHLLLPYQPIRHSSTLKSSGFIADLATAWYTLLATSIVPLRLVTTLSFIASLISLLYGIYVFYVSQTHLNIARGWTSMSLQNAGMFFLLFLLLAILSEYIFQIIQGSRNAPLYYVDKEQSSSVYIQKDRLNVTKD